MNKYNCETCKYSCQYKSNWLTHIESNKHKNNGIIINKKWQNKFIGNCTLCEYKTTQEIAFKNHMLTKHSTNEEKKNNFKFYCTACNYGTFDTALWKTHCNTKKHKYSSSLIEI